MMLITKEQARCFILRKQGLLGKHRFIGKEGAATLWGAPGFFPRQETARNAMTKIGNNFRIWAMFKQANLQNNS